MRIKIAIALVGAFALGCAAKMNPEPPVAASPLAGSWDHWRVVDSVLIVADASGSNYANRTFPQVKSVTQGLVSAMPDPNGKAARKGGYRAGMIAYGGDDRVILPLGPFDRSALRNTADGLELMGSIDGLGGYTPLPLVLEEVGDYLYRVDDNVAVVLITDGIVMDERGAIEAAEDIIGSHDGPGRACIHAVQVGDDERGTQLLQTLASRSGCGSFHKASEASTGAGMEKVASAVFLDKIPDADQDGVLDDTDACYGTASGAPVNEQGCWDIPPVEFDTAKHQLRPAARQTLDQVARILEQNPQITLNVDGHADVRGGVDYNQRLSERRVREVMNYLRKHGARYYQLNAESWSELQPKAPTPPMTADNLQRNRRVDMYVVRGADSFQYFVPDEVHMHGRQHGMRN